MVLRYALVKLGGKSAVDFTVDMILVGGFNPFEKYLVKLDHFPRKG